MGYTKPGQVDSRNRSLFRVNLLSTYQLLARYIFPGIRDFPLFIPRDVESQLRCTRRNPRCRENLLKKFENYIAKTEGTYVRRHERRSGG